MRLWPRSLRQRVPGLVLMVFIVVLGLFMWVLHVATLNSYREMERAQIVHDAVTARIALLSASQRLETTVADWARWTDTHEFMLGTNPTYPQENLDAGTIASLRLDFLAYCAPDGSVRLVNQLDSVTGEVFSQPPSLVASIEASTAAIRPSVPERIETGIIWLDDRPALFAACDITDNTRTAAPSGFLLIGTFIGPADALRVREVTGLEVDVLAVEANGIQDASPTTAEGVVVSYPQAGEIQGSVLLPAVDGSPAITLVVTSERTGTERALETLRVVGWGLVATIILFAVAMGIALDRTVLRRLVGLHEFVGSERSSGATAVGLVGGTDEITDLARALDRAEERARSTEEQLRHEVDHDHLTGLVNRRRLEQDASKALAEAARTRTQVSLLLIDVDDFKLVNDASGHACGDEVLKWFADAIQASVREYSTVARIGGDEFAVLLPHTSRNEAERVLERLRVALAADDYDCEGRSHRLSASIGLAVYPEDAADVDGMTSAADAAMYENKRVRGTD